MSAKLVIVCCVQALFAHVVLSQCVRYGGDIAPFAAIPSAGISSCGSLLSNDLAYSGGLGVGFPLGIGAGLSNGYAGADFGTANIQSIATSGGALPIQSGSAVAPSGISVASENAYEGSINVIGQLPFLSTVAFEAELPSRGSATVNHRCGNGITAITNEVGNAGSAIGFGSAAFGAGGIGLGGYLSPISLNEATLGYGGGRGCGCGLY